MQDITKLPLFVIREMWLDGKLSDADYTAEVQRRNDEILSLRSRAEKAEAERDELQKLYEAQGLSAFKVAKEWRAKAEKAEATCEKLAAALEAFANSDMRFAYETGHCESTDSCVKGVCDFTVGDLLNAESALAAYRKEASDAD